MSDFVCSFFAEDANDSSLPLYVTSIGLNSVQKEVSRENGYPGFHFFRCISGEGKVTAGNTSFHIKKNMGFILFPQEPHRYAPAREPWVLDWITFSGDSLPSFLKYLGVEKSICFDFFMPGLISSYMREFNVLLKKNKMSRKLDISSQLYKVLCSLYETIPTGGNRPRGVQYEKIEPAIRFIEENYAHPLSLEQLAEKAGVTPKYFCSIFNEAMRTRPFRYINSLRINECKRLLLERRGMNISEIAASCGYENISYFNQVFKDYTGMSPKEFRLHN